MLTFKEPQITDKVWIDEILKDAPYKHAENCFTNIFLWCDSFSTKIARFNDRIIQKSVYDGSATYSFPAGSGPLKPAIEAILENAEETKLPFIIRGISKQHKEEMETLYSGVTFTPEENSFDYVYSAEKLSTLAGKKLHAKRNYINRFLMENNWSYEPVTKDNINACQDMANTWLKNNTEKLTSGYLNENIALKKMFKNFDKLNLEGGILYVNKKVVAFTIGEVLSEDTFVTHFEKAYAEIDGAYPMINREFARQITELHPNILYINREEDMGLEYMRKAKQSYHPEFMAEKYAASWSK